MPDGVVRMLKKALVGVEKCTMLRALFDSVVILSCSTAGHVGSLQ